MNKKKFWGNQIFSDPVFIRSWLFPTLTLSHGQGDWSWLHLLRGHGWWCWTYIFLMHQMARREEHVDKANCWNHTRKYCERNARKRDKMKRSEKICWMCTPQEEGRPWHNTTKWYLRGWADSMKLSSTIWRTQTWETRQWSLTRHYSGPFPK